MWLCYALEKGRNGDLMSFSQNHIDVEVNMVGLNQKWRCTGFYGVADQAVKHRSWALLRHLATQSTLPWIVGEGYNEILSNEENEGGVARLDQLNEMFRLALMDCSLMDLSYEGDKFTWSNNKEAPYTVRCRLDMVCASSAWTTMFPNSFVEHLKYSASDHVPILFHTQRPAPIFGRDRGRPWRFKARCICREECEGINRDSWKEHRGGTTFERLFNGVEGCHMGLGLLTRGSGTSPHKRNYEKNLLFLDKELLTSKGRRRWGGVDGN